MRYSILKKADILLYIFFFVILIIVILLLQYFSTDGEKVVVSVDGEVYGTYSLDTDETIEIINDGKANTILIADGKALMHSANCNNQHCVHQGSINQTSQAILCLPNRVTVEIISDKNDGYDAIVN